MESLQKKGESTVDSLVDILAKTKNFREFMANPANREGIVVEFGSDETGYFSYAVNKDSRGITRTTDNEGDYGINIRDVNDVKFVKRVYRDDGMIDTDAIFVPNDNQLREYRKHFNIIHKELGKANDMLNSNYQELTEKGIIEKDGIKIKLMDNYDRDSITVEQAEKRLNSLEMDKKTALFAAIGLATKVRKDDGNYDLPMGVQVRVSDTQLSGFEEVIQNMNDGKFYHARMCQGGE